MFQHQTEALSYFADLKIQSKLQFDCSFTSKTYTEFGLYKSNLIHLSKFILGLKVGVRWKWKRWCQRSCPVK